MSRRVWRVSLGLERRIIIGKSHFLKFHGRFNAESFCGLDLAPDDLVTEKEAEAKLKLPVERCKNCEKVFAELTERRKGRK